MNECFQNLFLPIQINNVWFLCCFSFTARLLTASQGKLWPLKADPPLALWQIYVSISCGYIGNNWTENMLLKAVFAWTWWLVHIPVFGWNENVWQDSIFYSTVVCINKVSIYLSIYLCRTGCCVVVGCWCLTSSQKGRTQMTSSTWSEMPPGPYLWFMTYMTIIHRIPIGFG